MSVVTRNRREGWLIVFSFNSFAIINQRATTIIRVPPEAPFRLSSSMEMGELSRRRRADRMHVLKLKVHEESGWLR